MREDLTVAASAKTGVGMSDFVSVLEASLMPQGYAMRCCAASTMCSASGVGLVGAGPTCLVPGAGGSGCLPLSPMLYRVWQRSHGS